MVQTIDRVTLRWRVSISGPGVMPTRRNPPSRMAMAELPGTPKATVGMSAPPSFELFAAPGPSTPRTSPWPKPARSCGVFALCVA